MGARLRSNRNRAAQLLDTEMYTNFPILCHQLNAKDGRERRHRVHCHRRGKIKLTAVDGFPLFVRLLTSP